MTDFYVTFGPDDAAHGPAWLSSRGCFDIFVLAGSALTFEMLHKFNTLTDDMFTQKLKGFEHIIFEGAQ